MIYRIYPSKDAVITNRQRNGVPQTGSNTGLTETLPIFKIAGISGSTNVYGSASVARALLAFDLSEIAALTASGMAPTGNISYTLVLRDAVHDQSLPYSYDMEFGVLTRDWDEGRGNDSDEFLDPGVTNWVKAKSNVYWSSPGGDITGSRAYTLPYHFDKGDEDVNLDVGYVVGSWLTGGLPNYGFLARISSSLESSSEYNDYYVKKFHGRATNFPDKRPFIEAGWDDSVCDDRHNFVFDYSGSLYLFNVVRGALTNVAGVGTGSLYVRVSDASGTVGVYTGSYAGQVGVYRVTFAIPTGSYSGSTFYDVWFSGSAAYMTSSFVPGGGFARPDVAPRKYYVSIPNMKNDYYRNERVRFNMFVRPDDYDPALVTSASLGTYGAVITRGYYQITNDRTDEVVVPFGTGAIETTRLSYDQKGNYFNFYMSALSPGNVYRIVLLFDVDGQRQLIDEGFKFRVV